MLRQYPSLRGVVFDWPSVVGGAVEASVQAGVHGRCDVVGGNLFVRGAMTRESRLLVMDTLQPRPGDEGAAAQAQVLDDLTMLVRTGGFATAHSGSGPTKRFVEPTCVSRGQRRAIRT